MKKKTTLKQNLQEILTDKEFSRLRSYRDPTTWKKMSSEERELLGTLFVMQGEQQLKKGDNKAIESFNLAAKAAPSSAKVFYSKGLAYSEQDRNARCLLLACQALAEATRIDPKMLDAWYVWGYVLTLLGDLCQDQEKLEEAHEKFVTAEQITAYEGTAPTAEFFWRWGICWFLLGKLSGEAVDYGLALEKYQQAADMGLNIVSFWNDYGNALAEQALLLNKPELFTEVVELFRKAVGQEPDNFQGWLNLASSFQYLYEHNFLEEYFQMADQAFAQAAELYSRNATLWLRWGQLLARSGKAYRNTERLNASSEKFERADVCDPNNPLILAYWAEAQLLWGAYEEQYELLCEAEDKVTRSLALDAKSTDTWYIYGCCQTEMGRYFVDVSYFRQAIEKFQYGISLDESNGKLWYGEALAYYLIGEVDNDMKALQLAIQAFAKVHDLGQFISPQFWNDWGVAYMKLAELSGQKRHVECAIDNFERGIALFGQDYEENPLFMEILYNYGCGFDFLGDLSEDYAHYERAAQVLGKVVQIDPANLHARYNLALALSHLGELLNDVDCFEKAVEHFEVIVSEDPEDEVTWNDWGVTLLNLAQLVHDPSCPEYSLDLYHQAENKLRQSAALGSLQAFYNLACFYSLTGNYAAAMEYIRRTEQAKALPSVDDVMHDEWLAGLRDTTEFRQFISQLLRERD
ncbi:MAG: hypothetical protein H7A37_02150 [Chlamydiales bacterium]|nr:hypothetical protein [Chlamydiia bacterium]MCP5507093.1 hypothetical protein [Chlamydiales bacterium]